MTHPDDQSERNLDKVPDDLSPDDESRPDWLLDAAVDPVGDGEPRPELPRLGAGVPPPPPPRPPAAAPRVIADEPPPLTYGMGATRIETQGPLPEPDTFGQPAEPVAAAPPEPEAPSGPVAWTAAASSVPVVRTQHGRSPEELPGYAAEEEEERQGPPDHRVSQQTAMAEPDMPPQPAIRNEPFWLVALDELRTNRRVQIIVGVAAVLLLVIVNAPWKDRGVRLSKVLVNAAALDGQAVRVSGRVGEVFQVGGGYAFYLHDGRDSIVVFTRSFRPLQKSRIRVYGTVSTGVLDGAPRAAIFEAPDPGGS